MANGNIKIDAHPDTLAAIGDILGTADPDAYQSVVGTKVPTVDPNLAVSLMRRPGMTPTPAPTITGLNSPLTLTPYQRMSMSINPQPQESFGPPMRGSMLGPIPSATNPSTITPTIPTKSFFGKVGGVLGKIGHVAGKVGEIAGDALAPEVVANIPGTALNKEMLEHQQEHRDDAAADNALTKAKTDEAEALAAKNREGEAPGETVESRLAEFDKLFPGVEKDDPRRLTYALTSKLPEQRIPAEQKPIETEGGKLSTIGADNVLRPIMMPAEKTPPITLNSPIPGGTLPLDAPIAPQQATAQPKTPASAEPKTDEEIAITDRLAKLNLPNTPENRDGARLQVRKEMAEANRKPEDSTARDVARSDKSYQYHNNALDKIQTPIDQVGQRLGRLEDTLNQHSPQADALVAPELLSIMAGGQGSGIRMNEAEIARIVGGRSQWESLKASINKWNTDPSAARSITPEQDKEIRALVDTVAQKLAAKRQILDQARETLVNSDDPRDHKRALMDARKAVDAIDSGEQDRGGPIVQHNPKSGEYRYSTDGGSTWQKGIPPKK